MQSCTLHARSSAAIVNSGLALCRSTLFSLIEKKYKKLPPWICMLLSLKVIHQAIRCRLIVSVSISTSSVTLFYS